MWQTVVFVGYLPLFLLCRIFAMCNICPNPSLIYKKVWILCEEVTSHRTRAFTPHLFNILSLYIVRKFKREIYPKINTVSILITGHSLKHRIEEIRNIIRSYSNERLRVYVCARGCACVCVCVSYCNCGTFDTFHIKRCRISWLKL